MVTCRCGEVFFNDYGSMNAVCPKCKRSYPNIAPDMYHPDTEEEMEWDCPQCHHHNPGIFSCCIVKTCLSCGFPNPAEQERKRIVQEILDRHAKDNQVTPKKEQRQSLKGLLNRYFGK